MGITNKHGLSRWIPVPVRREVRRRCGFGCIICGSPFLVYHHFDPPYADAKQHAAHGITALCGTHAKEADSGVRSLESVQEHNACPWCRRAGHTRHPLDPRGAEFTFRLGKTTFLTQYAILYDNVPIVSVLPPEEEGAPYRVNALISDAEGKELFRIVNNEWFVGIDQYDITTEGTLVEIRERIGKLSLRMRLVVDKELAIEYLETRLGSVMIRCEGDQLSIRNTSGSTLNLNTPRAVGDVGIWLQSSQGRLLLAANLNGGAAIAMRV